MARRRSARSEPDLEDEDDDDYAWQPKEKKKKKKKKKKKSSSSKSATGKKKRSSSTEGTRSSGKRKRSSSAAGGTGASGKRKSKKSAGGSSVSRSGRRKGTGRTKRLSDDDEEVSASSRRRRSGRTPPKKKAGPPVALISIVTGTILICLIVLALSGVGSGPAKAGRDDPAELERADKLIEEGMAAFQEWSRAVKNGPMDLENRMNKKARKKLTEAIDVINAVLANYQDANGNTLKEYEGYEERLGEVAIYLIDLEKGARVQ